MQGMKETLDDVQLRTGILEDDREHMRLEIDAHQVLVDKLAERLDGNDTNIEKEPGKKQQRRNHKETEMIRNNAFNVCVWSSSLRSNSHQI